MLSQNQLNSGNELENWLEELEREFRFFKSTSPQDKKDAIQIYGGKTISRLFGSLSDPEDRHDKLDRYDMLRQKLNNYSVPKKNRHTCS